MQYQFYDLGYIERGKIVEVTLGYAANIRIMAAQIIQVSRMVVDTVLLVAL